MKNKIIIDTCKFDFNTLHVKVLEIAQTYFGFHGSCHYALVGGSYSEQLLIDIAKARMGNNNEFHQERVDAMTSPVIPANVISITKGLSNEVIAYIFDDNVDIYTNLENPNIKKLVQ